jgi:hypothetical protein
VKKVIEELCEILNVYLLHKRFNLERASIAKTWEKFAEIKILINFREAIHFTTDKWNSMTIKTEKYEERGNKRSKTVVLIKYKSQMCVTGTLQSAWMVLHRRALMLAALGGQLLPTDTLLMSSDMNASLVIKTRWLQRPGPFSNDP